MPLVTVHHSQRVADQLDYAFLHTLRESIAAALTCDVLLGEVDGHLDPHRDLEVFLIPNGPSDHVHCDLLIDIEALNFPERYKDRQRRANLIRQSASDLLGKQVAVAVWLKLVNATWAE